jgi:hypothetical protein
MTNGEAITALTQSEKIKTGITWITQDLEILAGLPEPERTGAERIIRANLHMLYNEVMLADRLAHADIWEAVKKSVNDAIVMANSGVIHEVNYHLTQAVSQVTTVSQRCMTLLREEGLL